MKIPEISIELGVSKLFVIEMIVCTPIMLSYLGVILMLKITDDFFTFYLQLAVVLIPVGIFVGYGLFTEKGKQLEKKIYSVKFNRASHNKPDVS